MQLIASPILHFAPPISAISLYDSRLGFIVALVILAVISFFVWKWFSKETPKFTPV